MTAVQSAFASPVVLTRAADLPVLPTAEFTRTLARRESTCRTARVKRALSA